MSTVVLKRPDKWWPIRNVVSYKTGTDTGTCLLMSKIYGTYQFCDEKQFWNSVISQKRHLYRNFVLEHRQTLGLKPLKSYKSDRWSSSHWQKKIFEILTCTLPKITASHTLFLEFFLTYWIWLASLKSIRSGRHRARDPSSTWALPSAFLIATSRAKMWTLQ